MSVDVGTVSVDTVVVLVFASLSIGAATGYVAGFVDGWLGRKFLAFGRRLYRRWISSDYPSTRVRLSRSAHVVRLRRKVRA